MNASHERLSAAWRSLMAASHLAGEAMATTRGRTTPAAKAALQARERAQSRLANAIAQANRQVQRTPSKRRVTDRELAQAREQMETRALGRWRLMSGFQQRCRPEIGKLAARALARMGAR